jgi:Type II secretion system (T2SS), protein M subtype b
MRPLTDREKRTLRFGGIGIAIYLLVFGGLQTFKALEKRRADYQKLLTQATALKGEIRVYDEKAAALKKLMDAFNLDPARLSRTTAVAEASAAIQKTAAGSGVMIASLRESPARPSSKELASVQLEAMGPVPAITALLGRLESVGYPLIVETVQINAEPTRPGQIKLNLTIVIMDFDQWKKGGTPNA